MNPPDPPTPLNRLPVAKTYKIYVNGKFPRTESGRYYALATAGVFVKDDQLHIAQYFLHRFEVEALTGHFRCFLIFGKNGREATGLTFGFIDNLGAVGFSFFESLSCLTTCFS